MLAAVLVRAQEDYRRKIIYASGLLVLPPSHRDARWGGFGCLEQKRLWLVGLGETKMNPRQN